MIVLVGAVIVNTMSPKDDLESSEALFPGEIDVDGSFPPPANPALASSTSSDGDIKLTV